MLQLSGVNPVRAATEKSMKVMLWQLIFSGVTAKCLLRKQAEAHNIQAGLEYKMPCCGFQE